MNFDKYINHLDYPHAAMYTTTYWYSGGKVVCTQKPGESLASGFDTSACVKERVCDDEALKAARVAYGAETQRIAEEFKKDLFADLGIENHPMRGKLYKLAWDDGHPSGFQEVYNCACNLVDLIEIPPRAVLVTPDAIINGGGMSYWRDVEKAAKALQKVL